MKIVGTMLAGALLLAPVAVMADVAPATAPAAAVPAKAKANLVLENFEGPAAAISQNWWAGCDSNNLGSTLAPQPFVAEVGGSKLSPGHSGRIHGHLGKSVAPWPFAQLQLNLGKDLRPYSALSFYVKGDGGHYQVELRTAGVKDYAYYAAEFDAPKAWTLVTLPLTGFAQPTWGKAVPKDFSNVDKISFNAKAGDKDYDFSIDDVTLVK